ncbi:MAG: SGNH/GDSL hydrolase family protein [Clostridia bacterium]|nr:SGNH/GDSL hydrolase family protein [Clostridia bacterium]
MSTRFFARFNLQNSLVRESFPARADILATMLEKSEDEIQTYLDEFEGTQLENEKHLKKLFAKELEALRGKRVLFLGDSITSDNLSYRTAVCRAASLDGIDGSVSGATSSILLGLAYTLIEKEKPDIVSLMIGANDSVSIIKEGFHRISLSEYSRNVKEIVDFALEHCTKLILFEITPVVEELFEKNFHFSGKQHNETIFEYNAVLKNISKEHGIELISNDWLRDAENMIELYEPDGLHLSKKGQRIFAAKWISAAAKII